MSLSTWFLRWTVVVSSTVAAFDTHHFITWFPGYESRFLNPAKRVMNETNKAFCNVETERYIFGIAPDETEYVGIPCVDAMSCLLKLMSDNDSISVANNASANVLLGLLPTVLATFGLSTQETSLMSSRRPLLSLLLSIGSPSIALGRLADVIQPFRALSTIPNLSPVQNFDSVPRKRRILELSISFVEYTVVLCAIVNNLGASIDMGIRGPINWSCESWTLPLVWSIIPIAIHFTVAIANGFVFRFDRKHTPGPSMGKPLWWLELTPCVSHQISEHYAHGYKRFHEMNVDSSKRIPTGLVIVSWSAFLMGTAHLLFGTVVFSSILFISTWDCAVYIVRFLISAIVCRAVMVYELAGLRSALRSQSIAAGEATALESRYPMET